MHVRLAHAAQKAQGRIVAVDDAGVVEQEMRVGRPLEQDAEALVGRFALGDVHAGGDESVHGAALAGAQRRDVPDDRAPLRRCAPSTGHTRLRRTCPSSTEPMPLAICAR